MESCVPKTSASVGEEALLWHGRRTPHPLEGRTQWLNLDGALDRLCLDLPSSPSLLMGEGGGGAALLPPIPTFPLAEGKGTCEKRPQNPDVHPGIAGGVIL
jgi:hypothetical protein